METLIQDFDFKQNLHLYRRGEMIFHQDTPAFGFYYILSGTVKIISIEKDGTEIILRLARAGDFIGLGTVMGRPRHTEGAKAIEDTHCSFIEARQVHQLFTVHPPLATLILEKIGTELKEAHTRNINLIKRTVRQRLAAYFVHMATHHADAEDNGLRLNLKLTREEMASLIGTAIETIIRFISEFKAKGFISEEERTFTIHQLGELRKISGA